MNIFLQVCIVLLVIGVLDHRRMAAIYIPSDAGDEKYPDRLQELKEQSSPRKTDEQNQVLNKPHRSHRDDPSILPQLVHE